MTDEVERIIALMMLGDGVEMSMLTECSNGVNLFDHHVISLASRLAAAADGIEQKRFHANLRTLQRRQKAVAVAARDAGEFDKTPREVAKETAGVA